VRLEWNEGGVTSYTGRKSITFLPSESIFLPRPPTGATLIPVASLSTSESELKGWVDADGGEATFCLGVSTGWDTAWAIKPAGDTTHGHLGCNSGNWVGRGAFYAGGNVGEVTYTGGWSGVTDNGEAKAGSAVIGGGIRIKVSSYADPRACRAGLAPSFRGATPGCAPCLAGTYSDKSGTEACVACARGTYQSMAGATACIAAHPGTFVAVTGAVVPTDCPVGTASAISGALSSSACLGCGPGLYSAGVGTRRCNVCPAGSFSAGTANVQCMPCAEGTASGAASHECYDCPVGTYSRGGWGMCMACMPGSYSGVPGAPVCTACATNTETHVAGASQCDACV
jgi:hypothetical protein